ncbi:hypothetical protein PQX77_019595 [Marasmius sp. AFHP31]|nr:hypothetical protein PQX77_019595 [Marasmius sp. AFHP31]
MDLLFTKNFTKNTSLTLPDGSLGYEISTPSRKLHTDTTIIRRYPPSGGDPESIGVIELHSIRTDVCQVHGKDFLPKSDSTHNISMTFTSSNGEVYKWRRESTKAFLDDKSEETVATYEEGHTGLLGGIPRQAKLSISTEAMDIIDEVVCTFFYIEQKEQTRRRFASNQGMAMDAKTAGAMNSMFAVTPY